MIFHQIITTRIHRTLAQKICNYSVVNSKLLENSFSLETSIFYSTKSTSSNEFSESITENKAVNVKDESKTDINLSNALPKNHLVTKATAEDSRPEDWNDLFTKWYAFYRDVSGISEMQQAHHNVNTLVEEMASLSTKRRALQDEVVKLHQELDAVHLRITDTPRYSDKHTALFEQARLLNATLLDEKRRFEHTEATERDCLLKVMSAIRISHETEQRQQQHTNYRTILTSIVAAAIGSIVTFMANIKRTRDTTNRIAETEARAASMHATSMQQLVSLKEKLQEQYASQHAESLGVLMRLEGMLPVSEGWNKNNSTPGDTANGTNAEQRKIGGTDVSPLTAEELRIELNRAVDRILSTVLKSTRRLIIGVQSQGQISADLTLDEEGDQSVPVLGEGLPLLDKEDFAQYRRGTGSSVYSIFVYMATGAVIGTLMTAVAFSGFR